MPALAAISANVRRRHLTESQRAIIAAKIATMKNGGDRRGDQTANLRTEKTIDEAAKELKVSPRSVYTGEKVLRNTPPEEVEKIERGEKTVHQ